MLNISHLHIYYGGIHAVQGVTLSVPKGKIITLIGANGAGKSSIIRSISGLIKQVTGSIVYTNDNISMPQQLLEHSPEDIVRLGISMSPEGRRILPHLTVLENLQLGAYIQKDAKMD